jgi:coupling of ubiquitin conjugation to ER degradation protein 1
MEQQKQKQKQEQEQEQEQAPITGTTTSATFTTNPTTTTINNESIQPESKKSFDDMSVDELNTLSAEQRRDHMLQVLQRRTSNS